MSKTLAEIFSKNLQLLRNNQKLSMTELGKQIGVSQSSISDWENAKKLPRMGAVRKLANYFQIADDDFFISEPDAFITSVNLAKRKTTTLPTIETELKTETLYTLTVTNNFMTPTLPKNSTLLVRKQSEVTSGNIFVIELDGKVEIKRIWLVEKFMILVTDNKEYTPVVITDKHRIAILGQAIQVTINL